MDVDLNQVLPVRAPLQFHCTFYKYAQYRRWFKIVNGSVRKQMRGRTNRKVKVREPLFICIQ